VHKIRAICLVMLFLNCSSETPVDQSGYNVQYDFNAPAMRITLPKILNEISGQIILDSVTIACVQDEQGTIFIYDMKKEEIVQQIDFAGDGDYEEICAVGADLFVLRSDGILFQVIDYASASPQIETYATGIPADNNEGLCYDSLNNRLLIACKSNISDEKDEKGLRGIYAFDLVTKSLEADPVYEFNVEDLVNFADQHDIDLPGKDKGDGSGSRLKFRISSIGIHPVTHELYVLSATDHALFIFAPSPTESGGGETLYMEMLDKKIFNKAEGISFYKNGDVLITNEAQDKKPTLLLFAYKK